MRERGSGCTMSSDFIGNAPAGVTIRMYLPGGTSGPPPPRAHRQLAGIGGAFSGMAASRRKSQHARFRPACDGA